MEVQIIQNGCSGYAKSPIFTIKKTNAKILQYCVTCHIISQQM